jgi:transposase
MDTCQFKTIILADVPRVKCPKHGTQTVKVHWTDPMSRFTAWFERFAIDVLLGRRKAGRLRRLCIDEKADFSNLSGR